MNSFEYHSPTNVIFGKGVEQQIGEKVAECGCKKLLIVYGGGSVKRSGLLDRVEKSLSEHNIEYIELGGVVPNPRLSLVQKGVEMCLKESVDMILGVGGGSVIDTAKAVAMGVYGDVWAIIEGREKLEKALPTCNILTLAATGSETGSGTVITNDTLGGDMLKKGTKHQLLRPVFTLMNPELMYTLPPYQTACGVVDIMMHTFERFFVPSGVNEMTDRIAEALLKTVMQYGVICYNEPENYTARSEVMWAGSLSHNFITGLGRVQDWATHQIEHELGGMFDVAHGAGLAAVWGSWARYVCKEADIISRFARYGVNVLGLPMNYAEPERTAMAAIEATERYFQQLDMPICISELLGRTLTDAEIEELSIKCTYYGKRKVGGAIKMGKEEIADVLKMANK